MTQDVLRSIFKSKVLLLFIVYSRIWIWKSSYMAYASLNWNRIGHPCIYCCLTDQGADTASVSCWSAFTHHDLLVWQMLAWRWMLWHLKVIPTTFILISMKMLFFLPCLYIYIYMYTYTHMHIYRYTYEIGGLRCFHSLIHY